MVIHVDLDIKVEVLPVVFKAGNWDPEEEPFVLYRPEHGRWEDGYARDHQKLLTLKNSILQSQGNFKPMIKVLKHLRSKWRVEAASFHLECLLYAIHSRLDIGGPADYIGNVLTAIASRPADDWYRQILRTPCGDRDIFRSEEWQRRSWDTFHEAAVLWRNAAVFAQSAPTRTTAIEAWQLLLGKEFFPAIVTP